MHTTNVNLASCNASKRTKTFKNFQNRKLNLSTFRGLLRTFEHHYHFKEFLKTINLNTFNSSTSKGVQGMLTSALAGKKKTKNAKLNPTCQQPPMCSDSQVCDEQQPSKCHSARHYSAHQPL